ncbi:UPF0182 family protein [Caminicella sporogenes]|uniref:UPF0182 family membrane protein n=1 Tax=Caminicella sporogenes TaxID=166485 RepID=UPI003A7F2381
MRLLTQAKKILLGLVVLVIIMISTSFNTIINFITDYKWFEEVGFEKVFLTKLITELKIGIPAFILITVFVYLYLYSVKKEYYKKVSVVYRAVPEKTINQIILLVSVFTGFISSISLSGNLWFDILKFINLTDFNISDPIFGKDISFYIFKYPLFHKAYYMIISFIFLLAIITIIFCFIMITLRRPTLVETHVNDEIEIKIRRRHINLGNGKRLFEIIIKQLTIIGVIFFIIIGVGYFLKTYELLYSQRGVVYGAGYTDIKVVLLKYKVLMMFSFVSAVLLVVGIRKRKIRLALSGPVLMIIVSIIGNIGAIIVQNYIVSPDEISKERKYIEYNIEYTQNAYNLKNVEEREFSANESLTLEDIKKNDETISNIRVNDYRPTKLVYNAKQGIRHYYRFKDVDIDRYYIDGKYTQVFLSARELDQTSINQDVLTFINKHLIYTHGYGIVLSPVNKVNAVGLPEMLVKNIPPITNVAELEVKRPEIYFGELTDNYIIVDTKEKEFDYPKGETNAESVYKGKAGIKLNGLNKLLFAYKQKSLKMLLSGNITSESKIILNRNIHERVRKIMPFIQYDSDPYIVLNDGKLYWIMDGYTISSNYPYSEPLKDVDINYIRNSVKVVIDAYNGTTTYYLADENDPLVMTYAKIFPQLFTTMDKMPEGLRNHIRYPQTLFDIQSEVYRMYHMKDPRVFYNEEDKWDIAKEQYDVQEQQIESNYLLMKLPGEEREEFILSVPYTPKGKDNMTAIFIGRSDGENYGKLVIYKLPKSKNIYGPMQIENRIDSDPIISRDMTYWNQQGSRVIRGNLLIIPIENSLLYVEPIYIKSANENSLPEVKRVIVAYGDKIVMEPTLRESLEKIFGKESDMPKVDISVPNKLIEKENINELIIRANNVFSSAQEAQRQGNWAEYGRLLKELERVLKRLSEINSKVSEKATVE